MAFSLTTFSPTSHTITPYHPEISVFYRLWQWHWPCGLFLPPSNYLSRLGQVYFPKLGQIRFNAADDPIRMACFKNK